MSPGRKRRVMRGEKEGAREGRSKRLWVLGAGALTWLPDIRTRRGLGRSSRGYLTMRHAGSVGAHVACPCRGKRGRRGRRHRRRRGWGCTATTPPCSPR
eukprot:18351-Prymnesium_polylepis.1